MKGHDLIYANLAGNIERMLDPSRDSAAVIEVWSCGTAGA